MKLVILCDRWHSSDRLAQSPQRKRLESIAMTGTLTQFYYYCFCTFYVCVFYVIICKACVSIRTYVQHIVFKSHLYF